LLKNNILQFIFYNKIFIITIFFILTFNFVVSSQNFSSDQNFVFIKGCNAKMRLYEHQNKLIKVKISDFYISKFEVTNKEYSDFLNKFGNRFVNHIPYINVSGKWRAEKCRIYLQDSIYKVENGYENYPVSFVSWYGADAFCKAEGNRLPTENEWIFASNGAILKNRSELFEYSGTNNADSISWFEENSENKIHEIGTKKANKFGLFDMTGNVSEWCSDDFSEENDNKIETTKFKVHKGGSFASSKDYLKTSKKGGSSPGVHKITIGFRVAKNVNK